MPSPSRCPILTLRTCDMLHGGGNQGFRGGRLESEREWRPSAGSEGAGREQKGDTRHNVFQGSVLRQVRWGCSLWQVTPLGEVLGPVKSPVSKVTPVPLWCLANLIPSCQKWQNTPGARDAQVSARLSISTGNLSTNTCSCPEPWGDLKSPISLLQHPDSPHIDKAVQRESNGLRSSLRKTATTGNPKSDTG